MPRPIAELSRGGDRRRSARSFVRSRPRAGRTLARHLVTWCRGDPSVIVRVSALEALVPLGARDARLRPAADDLLREALEARSPALRARARRLTRTRRAGPVERAT